MVRKKIYIRKSLKAAKQGNELKPELSKGCDNDIPAVTRSITSRCMLYGGKMLRPRPKK